MEKTLFIETCNKALECFGARQQLAFAKEELAELIVAISHYERGRDVMKLDLSEETADVLICIQQLIIAADIEAQVDIQMERKTDRLNQLISNHK